jgi:hypothetical protein
MTIRQNMATIGSTVIGVLALVLAASGTSGAKGSLSRMQTNGGRVTGTSMPRGWVAHSAYGLQLSVPKAWAVTYFRNCPVRDAGTLLIGTPAYSSFCPEISADANIVTMQPEESGAVPASHVRRFVVHGLVVISYSTGGIVNWAVPSENVVLAATGPQSSAVLNTLSVATSRAQAAPGVLKGSEYLVAVMRTPVTGLVSVKRLDAHGPALEVHAYDGQFSDTIAPGRYLVTGQDGDAPCPARRVSVRSGLTTTSPEIDCQGE